MNFAAPTRLPTIRLLIMADMILVAGFALLLIATAPILADATDLPVNLLRGAGITLVPWTAFLAITWKRPFISKGAVTTTILVNVAWVFTSLGIVATGVADPNAFGITFVLLQAAGVLLLAICQLAQWRTMP